MIFRPASRLPWSLCVLGIVMLVLSAIIRIVSAAFIYESLQIDRPVPLVLALFFGCFATYLLAIYRGLRTESKYLVPVVVGFAIAFRLVLLFSIPIQEIDIYRYIWDGHVARAGTSPFKFSPAEVLQSNPFALDHERNDELVKLRGILDSSEAKRMIVERIHYGQVPTVYPPVSQAVFRLAAATTPGNASFESHIVVMKSWIVAFDVATIFVVWITLKIANVPVGWLVAYAWCPLVLKEFANSGHLDSIAVCLSSVAIALVADALYRERGTGRRVLHLILASVFLALGVGAKLYPIALTPLIAVSLWRQKQRVMSAVTGGLFLGVTVVCLSPFLPQQRPPAAEETEAVRDPQEGLKVFLSNWMMNDLIFLSLAENVTPDELRQSGDTRRPTPWFVVMPNQTRASIAAATSRLFSIDPPRAPFYIARATTALIFIGLAFVFAWKASEAKSAKDWLNYVFLTMAWFWLLLPTLNPWYWIWALPWVAFTKNRVWLLLSGVLFTYYLRFYFGSHFEGLRVINEIPYKGEAFFDYVVVWFEYVPWFACLWGAYLTRMAREAISDPIAEKA